MSSILTGSTILPRGPDGAGGGIHGAVHYQHAYITHDIERDADRLRALHGMDMAVRDTGLVAQTPLGDREVRARVALGWHADRQYELIQPLSGHADFYREVLTHADRPAFHHVGARVADWEATRADIAASGLPWVLAGDLGDVRFIYVDARALLGHYLEYIWMSDARWAASRPVV